MPRRLQTKTAKRPQPKDVTRYAFPFVLSWIALAAAVVWCVSYIFANDRHTSVGRSVKCDSRPSVEMVRGCLPQVDGIACTHATRSQLANWWHDIDVACSRHDLNRPFVFPVYPDEPIEPGSLSYAEAS